MTIKEMIEHLERAAAEIEAVEVTLDDSGHECPACRLMIRHNYADHRNREFLNGLRSRLKRVTGSLVSSKSSDHQRKIP
jgi:hypothetical protein